MKGITRMHGADRQPSEACLLLNQMAKSRMENFPNENIDRRAIDRVTVVRTGLLSEGHIGPCAHHWHTGMGGQLTATQGVGCCRCALGPGW
jgi:hypothetical protein